jgi:hypothetical protein
VAIAGPEAISDHKLGIILPLQNDLTSAIGNASHGKKSDRRKFRSQTSYIFLQNEKMEKQRWEESEKRRQEERRSEKRKSQKTEDAGARKGRKVAILFIFPMFCGSGGKSRLAKAAGAEPSGEMRNEKLRAVVARSRFGSQRAKNTSRPGHFWTLC